MNQWHNAPKERTTSSNLTDLGWDVVRTLDLSRRTPSQADVVGGEATANACGVAVAKLQGHSWAPNLVNGKKMNVGTTSIAPTIARDEGKARCQLMLSMWGGGAVVVRARESRVHGKGLQRVRSEVARRGGRW